MTITELFRTIINCIVVEWTQSYTYKQQQINKICLGMCMLIVLDANSISKLVAILYSDNFKHHVYT